MVMRLDLHLPVALNLRNWPNDMQTFKVVFGSQTLSSREQELLPIPRQVSYWAYFICLILWASPLSQISRVFNFYPNIKA